MVWSDKDPVQTLGLSQSIPSWLDLPEQIAEWKLEPELASPIPRKVVLKRGVMREFFWVSTGSLLLGALFFSVNWVLGGGDFFDLVFFFSPVPVLLYRQYRRRFSNSLVTKGTATRSVVAAKERYSGEDWEGFQYTIAYEITSGYHMTQTVSRKKESWKCGDTLTILYLPESPERAMLYEDCAYKAVASPEVGST